MTSETVNRHDAFPREKNGPVALKVGLFSLGLSFAIWAIIAAFYYVSVIRFQFLDSWSSSLLFILSLCLTVLGLIAISSSLNNVESSDRRKVSISIGAFTAINLVGFLFLLISFAEQANNLGTFQGISWSPALVVFIQIPMFLGYLVIYGMLLSPYLGKHVRILLLIPSITAAIYFALVLRDFLSTFMLSSGVIALPGGIFVSPWEQLFNPFFGLPGLFFTDGFTNFLPSYTMLFAVISNLSYAFLFFLSAKLTGKKAFYGKPLAVG